MAEKKASIDCELCTACGICVDVCPNSALDMNEDGDCAILARPEDCDACGECVDACPAEAITLKEM
ncbi:MAG: ferredoxin [Candidatus Coatesbacteria bacterium]|nr:MAG: ferredoxin [Candidatus Coatesbacteria bacterium]RLC41434.1 MAG: ferredoxin [Candidatus Coatesbacteria bacterium]RLC43572.1 MAG: ferredoxin [Candidatus Coatesbacteria bacterium]HEC80179.1 4Fe-4S dicluster domain-containing protein [Bacillota bacterium]